MLEADVRLLGPAKLVAMARFYGLSQRGKRGIWVVRKSVTDPNTKTERLLKRSTKTSDLRLAVYRASAWVDQFVASVHGGKFKILLGSDQGASLKALCDYYETSGTGAKATRKRNTGCLRLIVADMAPEREFESISAATIDGRFARQWLVQQQAEAEAKYLPGDVAGFERAKRAANSNYRKARSVFNRRMMQRYEDAGFVLPATVAGFATQSFIEAAPPPPSEQLSPKVEATIWRLMPRLKQVRPAVWASVLLMWRAGLRNREAFMARWSWVLPTAAGGYVLRVHTQGDFTPKAKARIVALDPALVEQLRSVRVPAADGSTSDHIVPVEDDYRRRLVCYVGVNKFLHACGVTEIKGKIAYRLRGHAITEIILSHGMDAAQGFAGHSARSTTQIYQGAAVPYTPLAIPGAAS